MISRLFIIVLVLLIFGSCTKKTEKAITKVDVPSNLIGAWNWLYSEGGYVPIKLSPSKTGQTRKIEFNLDGNYRYIVNDTSILVTKFHIEKIPYFSHDSTLVIITNSWPDYQSFWFRTSDTLILSDGGADTFDHHFARIK